MAYFLEKLEDTNHFVKHSIDFTGYQKNTDDVSVVVETVTDGHLEEFVHDKCTFIYLILEGYGTFFLDDEPVEVKKGDMLTVYPGTRIYFFGNLKQVLITTPAYDNNSERHIRDVSSDENPYK